MPERTVTSPTVDDYFSAVNDLAKLVRAAFDRREKVNRAQLLTALERFERVDLRAAWALKAEQIREERSV